MVQLSVLLTALTATLVVAHPGHNIQEEAMERRDFIKNNARSLANCASKLKARGHTQRTVERRQALAESLRQRRAFTKGPYLKARDLSTVLSTSHESNLTGITLNTDETTLFSDNSSCVLQPEVTQGPYYVSGELVRSNITDGQSGVPTVIDIQIIDTSTCEPLPDIYMDFWHCNATGVYSGIVASGNGNANDAANINATFLRGLQKSDENGVVTFETIAPGHYTSRANHIHVLTHPANSTTLYPNNTLGTNQLTASHVGQLFMDQSLISQFEAVEPYASNTQDLTTNAEDSILSEEADSSDPVLEYVLLGSSIEDGILAWASIGIDASSSYSVSAAASIGEDGGSASSNSGSGSGGGGGSAPSGSFPSGSGGAFPSGTGVPARRRL